MDISQKRKQKQKQKLYRIHKIQFTDFIKNSKLKYPSDDTSFPLGREKKVIRSGKSWRDLGGKVVGVGRGVSSRGEPDLVLGEGKGLKP